jgi:hypothetical protein
MRLLLIVMSCFMAFSSASASSSFGLFLVVKGDVKVERIKKSTASVKVSDRIYPGDTVITGKDSRAKIVMSDRNIIFVSPKTRMTIAAYSEGSDKNVELDLKEGKVLNNVQQKYDGDKNKFIIKTPTAVAGVRGTSFITSYDAGTQITNVFTQTGVVTLSSLSNIAGSVVQVRQGETSSAAINAVPEIPKAIPPDQMRKLESDVTGSAPSPSNPTGATGDKRPSGDTKKNSDAGTAATAPTNGDGFRMGDKTDTSVDGIDKVPNTVPVNAGSPVAVPVVNRPPGRSLITDTIQNKDRPTKVIITPTRPKSGGN